MEQNLWNALHCTATKTELAVLTMYGQAISIPYTKCIQRFEAEKVNMLDLGDFHQKVLNHISKIIANPHILLSPTVGFEVGTLDGDLWELPGSVAAVHSLAPGLPHLQPVLVEFFSGAANTWERFTSEFTPGGLIDEATPFGKDLAWLPPTNDINEGALGSFRVLM